MSTKKVHLTQIIEIFGSFIANIIFPPGYFTEQTYLDSFNVVKYQHILLLTKVQPT